MNNVNVLTILFQRKYVIICICLCQLLVEPFRGQPCQVPIWKHNLASSIVSGLESYPQDGSQVGLAGCPFLVSVLYIGVSLGYRSIIAGYSGSTTSSFLKNLHTDFHRGFINLQSHQQWSNVPYIHILTNICCYLRFWSQPFSLV